MLNVNFMLQLNNKFKSMLRLLLMFTEVQYFCYDENYLPDVGLLQITTLQEVQEMNILIREAVVDEGLQVRNRFMLMVYAFIGISNRVLVSENDEVAAEVFMQFFPKDTAIKDFKTLRQMLMFANNYLTQGINDNTHLIEGYQDMTEWLNNLEIL